MTTVNIRASPKRYFPFLSGDESIPLSQVLKVLTTQIKPSGVFSENIADSFYNVTPESSMVFSVKMPTPILRWHPARKGTASKFRCRLDKIFPELEKVSDRALDRSIEEMRGREE